MSGSTTTLGGLARQLVQQGILTEAAAAQAWQSAQKEQTPFITYLAQNKVVKSSTLAFAVASEFGDPVFDLDCLDVDAIPQALLNEKLIRQFNALPIFKRGNRLFLALSDPTRLEAVDAFRFNTGSTIETVVVEADKLAKLIEKIIEGKSNASMQGLDDDLEDIDISGGEEAPAGDDGSTGNAEDDAPIVKYINKMLLDAIKGGASDLHFEPYEKSYRIRFRIDGVLREIAKPPVAMAGKMAARLKVMSQMDISERRLPQDGRIKLKLSKRPRHRLSC
jgi:type IV pilus assembly protein PilB